MFTFITLFRVTLNTLHQAQCHDITIRQYKVQYNLDNIDTDA